MKKKKKKSKTTALVPKKKQELTIQQEMFVENYVTNGFNATQAALDAGYTQGTKSYILLRNKNIQTRLQEVMEPTLQAAGISKEKLIMELKNIIDGKPTDVVKVKNGEVTFRDDLGDKSEMVRRISYKKDSHGTSMSVDFPDKLKAIELLMKALGINDQKKINVKVGPDADAYAAYEKSKQKMLNDELDVSIIDADYEIKE